MRKYLKVSIVWFASIVLSASMLTACKDDKPEFELDKPDVEFLILSANNFLTAFNASNVSTPVRAAVQISGLQPAATPVPAETILAIDYRPATGQLYGISSNSRLLVINPASGATTLVGSGPISPVLNGTVAAFDFNPTVDRIRIVTSTGQNLRINPETGAVTVDGTINGGTSPAISSCAYTNNFPGATTTTLFDIDVVTQKLYKQDPPNNGTLVEVGSLNLPVSSGNSGFDISPNGIALAVIKNGGNSALYQINLETGATTTLGSITNSSTSSSPFSGMAIVPNPVAYAVDQTNKLLIFNPTNTTTIAPIEKPITGLEAGENILGIDFRPENSQLYALGSTSRIYTINAASGVATAVSATPFVPLLSGTTFAFDFNPQADQIRIVSNNGQSLRISPATGLTAGVDGSVPSTFEVTAGAYSNNFRGATSTVLYVVDALADKLYTQTPATGVLTSVGAVTNKLGIDVAASNGFDIGGASGVAYGIFAVTSTVNGVSVVTTKIYSVNLTTGAATAGPDFPYGMPVRGFTIGLGF